MVLLVHVDNIIITGNDLIEADMLHDKIFPRFKIKLFGGLKYILGIEVTWSSQGIFISKQKFM